MPYPFIHRSARALHLARAASPLPGGFCEIAEILVDSLTDGADAEAGRRAIAAVANVHRVPRLAIPLPLEFDRGLGATVGGRYEVAALGRPIRIALNPDLPDLSFTLLHEIGHFVDQQLLSGHPGHPGISSRVTRPWARAIRRSGAFQNLRALERDRKSRTRELPNGLSLRRYVRYLLEDREVFARSYSQFIALNSTDVVLLEELQRAQGLPFYEQWDDADFQEIEAAFERILANRGWK